MNSSVFASRVLERAAARDLDLATPQIQQLERYYNLLRQWNRLTNLTALSLDVLPPYETIERLFLEPLVAARFIEDDRLEAFDLGSGGGSPAIPLKIFRGRLSLTMVEGRARKAAFLREAIRHLELTDANVLTERAENLPHIYQHVADVVTIRAVRIDGALLTALTRLLKLSGRLITFGSAEVPARFRLLHQAPLMTSGSVLSILGPSP